ncbi:MAG: VTT domain-containing protein [Chloroflexota bacterium]
MQTNQTDTYSRLDKIKSTLRRWEFWVGILTIGLTFSLSVLVVIYWQSFQEMASYSYLGMFLISIIGGATVIIPVPSLALQFTMGAVLHPAIIGAVSGLGTGIGGTLIYLFGRSGRRLFFNTELSPQNYNNFITRWLSHIMGWAKNRGSLTIFLMSAALNPVFFPMALAIGASRFQMWRFFTMCWAGNTVKSMIIAYLGYFGLGFLLRSLGIDV